MMQQKELSGRILYLILWGGTALIALGMIIVGYRQQVNEKSLLKNAMFSVQTSNGEMINELLLSADELTIEEKKSFISLNLKTGENSGAITPYYGKSKSEEIYKQIFQRKINKLKGRSSDDFSVKPIPK